MILIIVNFYFAIKSNVLKYRSKNHIVIISVSVLQGFVPLFQSWESFYTRNVYRRIRDCWNRPIGTVAGAHMDILERKTDDCGWNFR